MSEPIWKGDDWLRDFLTPIGEIRRAETAPRDDIETISGGLQVYGQRRPVLLDSSRVVSGRGYLVDAAVKLGWTHIAARLEAGEQAMDPNALAQTTLADEIERTGMGSVGALARAAKDDDVDDVEAINALSSDPDGQWVGLPEFIGVREPFRVVISLDSEDDREALFDVLGIVTIHKGTRGTLSFWWPDRPKEDLASLRFDSCRQDDPIDDPIPDFGIPGDEPDLATAPLDELRAYYDTP